MRWDVRGDEVWLVIDDDDDVKVEDVVRERDAAGYCPQSTSWQSKT